MTQGGSSNLESLTDSNFSNLWRISFAHATGSVSTNSLATSWAAASVETTTARSGSPSRPTSASHPLAVRFGRISPQEVLHLSSPYTGWGRRLFRESRAACREATLIDPWECRSIGRSVARWPPSSGRPCTPRRTAGRRDRPGNAAAFYGHCSPSEAPTGRDLDPAGPDRKNSNCMVRRERFRASDFAYRIGYVFVFKPEDPMRTNATAFDV